MKKLLEIQEQYMAELEKAMTKPIELLTAAKYAAGNNISACTVKDCTTEKRCNFCTAWIRVWHDIDKFLGDNNGIL